MTHAAPPQSPESTMTPPTLPVHRSQILTQLGTALLGLVIIFVLFPAVTMGALASPWLGLVSGLVCVAVAALVSPPGNLLAPRLLCGVFGLLTVAWALWFLAVT